MSSSSRCGGRAVRRSVILFVGIVALGAALAAREFLQAQSAAAAAASMPEPMEVVTEAFASTETYRAGATSIGTVRAIQSITLRNEVEGTVAFVGLTPGAIVERGAVLVALDVSVEEAGLRALEARAHLAESTLARLEELAARRAVSQLDRDNAQAERDMALAEIERTRAIIARKTILAPFRARVGISDVHLGQFLDAGTTLTTLQGVEGAAHVDFEVSQTVAAGLRAGDIVQVFASEGQDDAGIEGRILAVDALVDATTRNATVRARIEGAGAGPAPGASVRVQVPVGEGRQAVVVPVNALRRGPAGDHVWVLAAEENGMSRAEQRRVEAGPVLGDHVVVLTGLEPGERIAASGSFKLREGLLVATAPPAEGSDSAAGTEAAATPSPAAAQTDETNAQASAEAGR